MFGQLWLTNMGKLAVIIFYKVFISLMKFKFYTGFEDTVATGLPDGWSSFQMVKDGMSLITRILNGGQQSQVLEMF